MSSDFAFWKHGAGDPEEIFDGLAEGDTGGLRPGAEVLRFRAELLTRWPDMINALEPSEDDLDDSPEDASTYALLTLSVRQLDHLDEVLSLAREHGLVGYSGVAGEPI